MRPVGAEVGELAAQGRCVLACVLRAGWQVTRTAPLAPRELGRKVQHATYIFVEGGHSLQ